MEKEYEEWENIVNDIKVEKEEKNFKLTQLRIDHYYYNSGDLDKGMPINTSIELTCKYNFEKDKPDWKKTISHTYISFNSEEETTTNTYEEDLDENIIKEIEKYDLRKLKNNYFTDENPERFSRWEITYNNHFKIVGTYDEEIEELINIKRILDFKKIMEEELDKVK